MKAINLSALRASHLYSSVSEELSQQKIPITPSAIEPATFWLYHSASTNCATAFPVIIFFSSSSSSSFCSLFSCFSPSSSSPSSSLAVQPWLSFGLLYKLIPLLSICSQLLPILHLQHFHIFEDSML
jgi:hypothetical protein